MFIRFFLFFGGIFLVTSCMPNAILSPKDVKELAVKHFNEKEIFAVRDTGDIGVLLVHTSLEEEWYVAFNTVMTKPALFLYHINKPFEPPHYIPLQNKSAGIIEHVYFRNVTNDDFYELVIELHVDYGLAYQCREIIILRHPFENKTFEVFNFAYEQVWENIDSFDNEYGLPNHSKRIENHATYEFFEGFILLKGTINYRENHLVEYKWDEKTEEFLLILDEDVHEIEEEEHNGGVVHKAKGNKILVEVNSHEDGCIAYLVEDVRGHVIDVAKKIHDDLLCSPVASLSPDGRFLIYTDHQKNAVCLYDFDTKTTKVLLADFKSYEGVSEVDWAQGTPFRFAFISVNHEELLGNTKVHIFTFDKKQELQHKSHHLKIHYDCSLEGWCVPQKDYNFKFDRYNRFLYTSEKNGTYNALVIK